MTNDIKAMLASAPTLSANGAQIEAQRKQAYRALVAYDKAKKAADAAAEKAKATAQKAAKAEERYLSLRAQLDFTAKAVNEEPLPVEWCERFEQSEEARKQHSRERVQARKRAQPDEGASHEQGTSSTFDAFDAARAVEMPKFM